MQILVQLQKPVLLDSTGVQFSSCYFGLIIAVWLIINELISILENLTEIGTPIPKFLVNIVHRLKNTVENKVNSDTDKEE
ncbi:MAG: phage holin family protein [Ruminococcus sp.]